MSSDDAQKTETEADRVRAYLNAPLSDNAADLIERSRTLAPLLRVYAIRNEATLRPQDREALLRLAYDLESANLTITLHDKRGL